MLTDDAQFREGMKAAAPIVLGYLPVGLAFGVLAQKSGLTPPEAGLMSLLVYAGSSQFVAVEMISQGAGWIPIVIATFLVNLRHLLMSSTLSLHFRNASLRTLGLLAAQITDESFAVAMANPSKVENRPRYLLGLQMTSQAAWIAASLGGAWAGSFIDSRGYGLPFALPSLFICLLVLQLKSPVHLGMMILAGALSLLFKWTLPGNWYIVLAAVFTAVIGALIGTGKPGPGASKEGAEPMGART